MSGPMCGAAGNVKPATEDIQKIVDGLKGHIETKTGKKHDKLEAVSYRSQVVAGTNYFIKVKSGAEHLHLRVFKPLPMAPNPEPELHGVQSGKTEHDELQYFDASH